MKSDTTRIRTACTAVLVALASLLAVTSARAQEPATHSAPLPETAAQGKTRHQRVSQRRAGIQIICHRGAVEFAHENTLEAYQAAFALGADGNEIDIRATKDGVIVCFHDDMLDHILEAYGDVSDYTWKQLQQFPFRRPGPFGQQCRIPTLLEVFELHRRHAGVMHLDIKRPELARPVMQLLEAMDMWDHVVQAPPEVDDPRVKRGRYKAGLYLDRTEIDAEAIAAVLARPGDSVIVEDPRAVAVALARKVRHPSDQPVAPRHLQRRPDQPAPHPEELLAILRDAADWNQIATGPEAEAQSGARIQRRAAAADRLAQAGVATDAVFETLQERVRNRSLHRHWRFHGLDGAAALRALIHLKAPHAVALARDTLWRDDPAIKPLVDPQWNNPRSWTDFRIKAVVFPALESLPGAETEQLCRDYLALDDEAARQIGILQFEAAARTLLTVSPTQETAVHLMRHRRSDVRGRTILVCLARSDQSWARQTLATAAPHALQYILHEPSK